MFAPRGCHLRVLIARARSRAPGDCGSTGRRFEQAAGQLTVGPTEWRRASLAPPALCENCCGFAGWLRPQPAGLAAPSSAESRPWVRLIWVWASLVGWPYKAAAAAAKLVASCVRCVRCVRATANLAELKRTRANLSELGRTKAAAGCRAHGAAHWSPRAGQQRRGRRRRRRRPTKTRPARPRRRFVGATPAAATAAAATVTVTVRK